MRGGAWTGWRPTHMLGTQVSGKTLGPGGHGPDRPGGGQAGARRLRHAGHLPRSLSAAARRARARSGAEPREQLEDGAARGRLRLAPLSGHAGDAPPDESRAAGPDAAGRVPDQHRARRRGGRGGAGRGAQARDASPARASTSTSRSPRSPAGCSPWRTSCCCRISAAPRTETRVAMGMRALENLRLFFGGVSAPRSRRVTHAALEPFSAPPPPRVG